MSACRLTAALLLALGSIVRADPVIGYGTYFTPGGYSTGKARVAVDPSGNMLLAGGNAFVAKFDPSGSRLLFRTAIDGNDFEDVHALVADAAGDAIVGLGTASDDLPTPGGVQQAYGGGRSDGYVAVLDPSGAIVYGSYLGGLSDDGIEDVAVDGAGRIVLAGYTVSSDFPVVAPVQGSLGGYVDAFVTVLEPSRGAIALSTYLGGVLEDRASGVAVDPAGFVHLCGRTASADFPIRSALQGALAGGEDAFVAGIDVAGSALIYSTYLGGSDADAAAAIAVDGASRPVVVGTTTSADFPTAAAVQPLLRGMEDAFVTRLASYGVGLSLSTYLGGIDGEIGEAVAIDGSGAIHVAGFTPSPDFPVQVPLQGCFGGGRYGDGDAFVTSLDPAGASVAFSTFLGGADGDRATDIGVDGTGRLFVAGTTERDFPVEQAYQPLRSNSDFVLLRIDPGPRELHAAFASDIRYDDAFPLAVAFQDCSRGPVTSRLWDFGDGTTSTLRDPAHVYEQRGTYTVSLTVTGGGESDVETKVAYVAPSDATRADFSGAPTAGVAPLTVAFADVSTWAANHFWSFGDGGTSTEVNPSHTYTARGTYNVSLAVSGPGGSDSESKVGYIQVKEVQAAFSGAPRIGRAPLAVQFTSVALGPVLQHSWSFGDGATSAEVHPVHTYAAAGRYDVSLTVTGPTASDTVSAPGYVLVSAYPPAGVLTAPGWDPAAPSRVRAFDVLGTPYAPADFLAYGTTGFGCNVAAADLEGTAAAEILTGPGPGAVFGPQVRAFRLDATAIARVNFFAYGTPRFGAVARGGDVDGEARSEILTGAGPGAVFGPHVRGFDDDGTRVTPIPHVNLYAYGTLRYGVNLAAASIQDDLAVEILTGPGPGIVFAPQVRAFDPGPPLASIRRVNFLAFALDQFGCRVAASELDGDGPSEILASPGPGRSHGAAIAGFDFDGTSVRPVPPATFLAFATGGYGADPEGGDLDGDGDGDILVTRGPDPTFAAEALGFDFTPSGSTPIPGLALLPYPTYGLHTATGDLGF